MFKASQKQIFGFLLILLLSALYFFKLSQPNQLYWDETLHVEGAKTILYHQKPYLLHAHPPLGKEILALSMKIFGDSPWGSRMLSAFAGVGCLIFTFLFIFKLSQSFWASIFAVLLFVFDPLFYVHARIGMLDVFVLFSLLLSCWMFLKLRENPEKLAYYWIFGFCLGFGLIVKSLLVVFYPLFCFYFYQDFKAKSLEFKHYWHLILALVLPPLAILYSSYAFLGYSFKEMGQHMIWGYHFLKNHQPADVIVSRWTDWIFVQKPMWYFYKEEAGKIATVYLTGNFVFWLVTELLFLVALVSKKLRPPYFWFCFIGIVIQFLFWTLKPGTHFYYMLTVIPFYVIFLALFINNLFKLFPDQKSGIILNAVIFLLMGIAVFVHYYPLMNGKLLTHDQIQNILQFKSFSFFG